MKDAAITGNRQSSLRILVAEFLLANSNARQNAAPSMLDEAAAMLKAVVADLAALPDVEVTVLLNAEINLFEIAEFKNRIRIQCEELQPETLRLILQRGQQFNFDAVLFVAPECDGVLVSLLKAVQESAPEVHTFNLHWRLAEIFADKYATAAWLRQHHIATIPVCTIDDATAAQLLPANTTSDAAPAAAIDERCVLKPRDGAGAEGVQIVRLGNRKFGDLPPRCSENDRWLLQPFIPGVACSVGFIGGGDSRPTTILLPTEQNILMTDGKISYSGGQVPCDSDFASRIAVVAAQLAAAFGKFDGYVGVDLLVDLRTQVDSLASVRVVEINPRLCTSYVGYRALALDNLAGVLLQQPAVTDIRWKPGVVRFFTDGTIIMSQLPAIRIRGARTHNLRNIDVDLPTGKLIVMTGVSGSGKSSLAFDTLFAEGQRRYLDSVSVQTRTLLRQLPRPDVDDITGLSPTISVDQRVSSVPARSTLAVTSEIHDYLRLLYARGGTAHCTGCGRPVQRQSVDQILQATRQLPDRTRLMILSPMVRGRRGGHKEVLERIARHGFVRARINGEVLDLAEAKSLDAKKSNTIEAIVDRIVLKEGIAPRLRESIELACRESDGTCIISHETDGLWTEKLYSTRFSCPDCDLGFATPEPRSFSFNSPWGACPDCAGFGLQGAVDCEQDITIFRRQPCVTCHGSRLQPFPSAVKFQMLTIGQFSTLTVADALRTVDDWMTQLKEAGGATKASSSHSSPPDSLSREAKLVAERTLPDIRARLKSLDDVGIGYLTLDRPTRTLSGGEFQRARLAASLSSPLYGACLILDEPTAGLHPRDTQKLLMTLRRLRDSGSTVIVVEHDGDVIRAADWLIDLGPGAGADGGQLLFAGTPSDAREHAKSPTGDYLRGALPALETAPVVVNSTSRKLTIRNARLNNLKNVSIDLPLHCFVCVTGVSGSGKSSLITDTLLPIVSAAVMQNRDAATAAADARCDGVDGIEQIQRVVSLDQSPLGRSSRSCIATLCGIWNDVRKLFTKTREARVRGFTSQHFSFNSGEGRCRDCRGTGTRHVRMSFLPDAVISCPTCNGMRFSAIVRSIRFRDHSVADILNMRIDEAAEFFREFQKLHSVLETFRSVGLGYLTLGQPASTFSGGEAQRAKLASELATPTSQHTLYLLDEPTSGLHPADVVCLMRHLRELVNAGHSMVVIEHNADVICGSDWILDIGPDSAEQGGRVVFSGRNTEIAGRCTHG